MAFSTHTRVPRELRRIPSLPFLVVRNVALEQRLDTLLERQAIVRIVAPAGSGKSIAIASWLRNSAIDRYPTWIESTLDADDRADVVARIREVALSLCGDNPPKLEWGTAPHRRAAARTLSAHMTRHAIFVVNRPAPTCDRAVQASDSSSNLHYAAVADRELFDLIVECEHLSLVIIENTPPADTACLPTTPATLGPADLALSAATLRLEAHRLGASIADAAVEILVQQFAGSPVIAARYFQVVFQNPTLGSIPAIQQAHLEVLVDAIVVALQSLAPTALALMAVLESTTAQFLQACLSVLPLASPEAAESPAVLEPIDFADALESLAGRHLIDVIRREGAAPQFALPESVREHVRARTITQYLSNRVAFHTAASAAFLADNDMFEAVRHLILIDEVDSALGIVCAEWDRRDNSVVKRVCDLFHRDYVLAHLEAVAVVWLVESAAADRDGVEMSRLAHLSDRLRAARMVDIGVLELRARITVRAAMTRVLLGQNLLGEAEATVADAASDVHRAKATARRTLGGAYTEHLLSAAHCALIGGDLIAAHRFFASAQSAGRARPHHSAIARATLGLALCSIFNADFEAAQRHIDGAAAVWGATSAVGELELTSAWAQILLWSCVGADAQLIAFGTALTARARADIRWNALAQFVDAARLASSRCFADATNVLRNLSGLTLGGLQQPLFQQTVQTSLALMAVLSGRPGTGFTALSITPPSENHAVCFNAFRALLEAARADPSAALRATDECIANATSHARLMLPYVYLSRSIAFSLQSHPQASADALAVSRALASGRSQRVPFAEILARFADRVASASASTSATNGADPVGQLDELAHSAGAAGSIGGSSTLTPKERQVLTHLAQDGTLSVIATSLFVSENTLKSHTRSIYRKLGVSSRREATDRGALWGLV